MKKKALIAIIVVVAVIVLAGGGTAAYFLTRSDGGGNDTPIASSFELAEVQEFSYDGGAKQPIVTNLSDEDKARIVYSYSKKDHDNPENQTYTQGLPVDAGTYFVKVSLGDEYKFTTLSIIPSDIKLEELSVVYNQMVIGSDYFTSEFDARDVEFLYSFTQSGEEVEGTLTLDAEALLPSISTYAYTFTPSDKNFAVYRGSVDIRVYAMINLFKGTDLDDYREVAYGSYFDDSYYPTGFSKESSHWMDENGVEYTNEKQIFEDTTLYLHNRLFSITYHLDGGTNGNTQTNFDVETDTIYLATATKTGYKFVGWYLDPEFENPVTKIETKETLHDVDLYAQYETTDYVVSYSLDGGFNSENNPSSVTVEDVIALEDAQKVGHNFVGWYIGDEKIETLQNVSSNITLTARFEIAHYTIKFESRGGTPVDDLVYEYGEEVNVPTDIEKTDYIFNGWYKDEECTEIFKDTQMPASDLTLYAKFTLTEYAITYHLDGGTNGDNPYHYTIEQNVIFEDATKTGHIFGGWYAEDTFENKMTEIPQGTTGDIELYAKFVPVEFAVTFETNGGVEIDPIGANFGEAIVLPNANKLGYDFDGWFDDKELTSPVASPYTVTQNITLYAKYTIETYTITYYLDDGTNAGDNPTEYTVESETLAVQPASKAGHTFVGWYNTSELTGDAVTEIAHGSTGNKSLFAKFEINEYTVTFDTNGGDAIASINANYGETVNLPATQKAGYNFIAWFDATLTTPYSNSFAIESNLTVYAKYEFVQYAIAYELNGGNAPDNLAVYNVESETFELQPASKSGYEFDGWYDNSTFEGEAVTSVASGSIGNKTFYAKFTPITYTITYNLNGGTNGANPASYTIESDTINLAGATKNGYVFAGWYTEAGFENKVTSVEHGSTGDVELFAKFTIETYTITYNLNGGTNGANPANYTIESETLTLADAQKTGYTFVGWYEEADFENEVTEIAHGSHGNVELFAKFEINVYTVIFETNGGDAIAPINANYGKTVNLPAAQKAGYSFIAWFDSTLTTPYSTSFTLEDDLTVYAKYEIVTYTITYNLNGDTNGANPANYTIESETINLADAQKTGYTFAGWYTEAGFENAVTSIAHGSHGNVELFAKFVANSDTQYLVKHYTEKLDGTFELYQTENKQGVTDTNTQAAFIAVAHFTPIGEVEQANIAGDGTTVVELRYSRDSYVVTFEYSAGLPAELVPANQTKTVKYEQTVGQFPTALSVAKYSYEVVDSLNNPVTNATVVEGKVTYYVVYTLRSLSIEYHNVETPIATQEAEAGTEVTLATTSNAGYTFVGWATTAGGAKAYDGGETITMPNDSLDLYALWEIITYTITYHLDDGTNGANPANYTIETATITLANATKAGYTFGGWYLNDSYTGGTVTNITIGSTGDVELYAKFSIETYAITYNLDGGTNGANPATYTVESETINLADATKNGYAFGGWYGEAGFVNQVTSIASGSTGDRVLYAKFTPINYTITYNNVDGLANTNPTSFTIESSTIVLQNVAKDYYTFGGWYSEAGFVNQVTSIASGSTGDRALYAKFTPINYTITYNNVDGLANTNPTSFTIESSTIVLQNVAKDYYTFGGWYDNAGFTGSAVTEIASGSHGNVELYAKFTPITYTITYNLNGGTNGANPATYTIETSTITLNGATKSGYVFEGWYRENGFVNKVTEIAQGSTGDVELFAKFTIETYTITYNLNGGTNGANPESYTVETDTITLLSATKNGYSFGGWYDNSSFTGSAVTKIAQGSTGNKVFYAKFTPVSYTITYVNVNGLSNSNPTSYTIESSTIALQSVAKDYYTFGGWYDNAGFTGSAVTSIASGSTGNKVFYAKYTPIEYSISYNLSGGTNNANNPATYTVETSTITLLDATKTGYDFMGWYKDSGFSNQVTEIANGSHGNVELYAKFTPITYTITYNLNGGTNGANPATYTIETSTITLNGATKSGYVFEGWYRESGFVNKVTQIAKGSTGAVVLYANFVAESYSITYVLNGGTNGNNPASYTINDTIVLADATKEGYDFVGWYLESTFTTPITQISSRTGALTLFAKFELKGVERYYITYVLNGGENNAQNPASYTQNDASFMLKDPSKGNAYTFAGWYLDSAFATRIISVDTDEMAEDITVYAKWTPLQYTILYYDGSERITTLTRNTYTIEDSFALENYSKFNHTFGGWYTDSALTTPMSSITAGTTGTIKLYAKTTDKGFTVKFYDTDKSTLLDTKTCATYGSVAEPSYTYDNATYILKWVDANGIEQSLTNVSANLTLHAELIVISYTATVYYVDADGYAYAKTSNASITSKSVGNLTFGNSILLTRQMRVTDTSAYDLFYMSPVSTFDWSLAVTSIVTGKAATAADGTQAAHVSISGTSGTLTIFVFCVQPVAIVTASSTTLPYENNLDMSTSTYQFYKTIDEAFAAFASTTKLMRIYGRSNGTLASNCFGPTVNTTIAAASTTVDGVAITRPRLVYNYSDSVLHNSYTVNGNIILPHYRGATDVSGYVLSGSAITYKAVIHSVFVVDEGVTLTIKKSINVGGDIYGNANMGSHAVLMNHGTIRFLSGSTLNAYGYVKGQGLIIAESGTTVTDLFKAYNWPGGRNASGLKSSNIFPISVYAINNISSTLRIYSGATYKAWIQIETRAGDVNEYITLVGSGGLFALTSGYVDKWVEETTSNIGVNTNFASNNLDVTLRDVLDIHGNFSDNTVSVTVSSVTVSTGTSMAMPIGFMRIIISEGTGTLSKNSYKFLPGSSLEIKRAGALTISKDVKVVSYYEYPDDYAYKSSSDATAVSGVANSYSYQNKHSAIYTSGAVKEGYHPVVIVDGKLDIKGNFGGKISATSSTGTVSFSNTSVTIVKCTALTYTGGLSLSSSVSTENDNVNAEVYFFNGSSFEYSTVSATTYVGIYDEGQFGFVRSANVNSFKLTYNSAVEQSSISINTTEDSYTLSEGDLPDINIEGYSFEGWYIDTGYTTPALGYTISANTNVYAKMTPIVYNIEYHTFILDDYDESQPLVNSNPTYFTVEDTVSLVAASCGDLNFNGWYIDEQFSVNAPNVTSSTLSYYKMIMDGNTIHLYGYLSSIAYYSIVYRYETGNVIDSIESQTVVEGTTITFAAALPTEDRTEGVDTSLYAFERYTFSKWIVFNSNGTQIGQYDAGASYTPTSSITVVPYFVKSATYVKIAPGTLSNASYTVKVNGTQVGTSSSDFNVVVGTSLTFTITYSEDDNKSYTYAPASGNSSTGSGTSLTVTANYNATMSASSSEASSCIVKGTLITLADGTTTEVENVQAGDLILVFNHETGEYDVSMVMFNDVEPLREQVVINLYFDNGAYVGVVSEHGFFDLDLMKYVYITADNYGDYVGHRFYAMDGETVLENAYLTVQEVEVYSPVTAVHLNLFTNGLLSMPGGVPGLFNIFEYGEDLKYDEEKMNADIEEYGLLDYAYFEDMIPYDVYVAFNGKYLGIAMAKGILTEENLAYYVERYSKFW